MRQPGEDLPFAGEALQSALEGLGACFGHPHRATLRLPPGLVGRVVLFDRHPSIQRQVPGAVGEAEAPAPDRALDLVAAVA